METCSNIQSNSAKQACEYTQDTLSRLSDIATKDIQFLESELKKTPQNVRLVQDLQSQLEDTKQISKTLQSLQSGSFQNAYRNLEYLKGKLYILENSNGELFSGVQKKFENLFTQYTKKEENSKVNLTNAIPQQIAQRLPEPKSSVGKIREMLGLNRDKSPIDERIEGQLAKAGI